MPDNEFDTKLRTLVATVEVERLALIAYCGAKMVACDWHAVQDAASDIRELDAVLDALADVTTLKGPYE